MAAILALAGGIGTGIVSHAQAGDPTEDAEARAVINRAIQAHGGADKLSQFKAQRISGSRQTRRPVLGQTVMTLGARESLHGLSGRLRTTCGFCGVWLC